VAPAPTRSAPAARRSWPPGVKTSAPNSANATATPTTSTSSRTTHQRWPCPDWSTPRKGDTALVCTYTFSVTEDAGATWQQRTAPGVGTDGTAAGSDGRRLWVFDQQTVVVGGLAGGTDRWLSTDGGRSWSRPQQATPNTVTSAPPGAVLVPSPQATQSPPASTSESAPPSAGSPPPVTTEPTDFVVIVPDGTTSQLPGPPDVEVTSDVASASDGSSWAGCRTLPAHEPCVAVTTDHGKTWKTTTLTDLPASYGDATPRPDRVSTVDGHTVYCSVRYQVAGASDGRRSDGLLALLRSTDGGASWAAMRLPTGSYAGGEAVLSGDLIGIVGARIARLPADGTAFQATTGTPRPVTDLYRSGSLLVADPDDPTDLKTVYLSKDGSTWSKATPP
jgi:hypothetical protein